MENSSIKKGKLSTDMKRDMKKVGRESTKGLLRNPEKVSQLVQF